MRLANYSVLLLAALLAGCSSSDSGTAPPQGPDSYRVKFETTKGDFYIDVVRSWSPIGADRFHQLVKMGFYDSARFFRIVPGFVVQFGIKGDPALDSKWMEANIPDDPPAMPNTPATVTFAKRGEPNTRSTQIFINLGDNRRLDSQGFTPFGRVTEGMGIVTQLHSGYGESPDQMRIRTEGNAYLQRDFPNLDYIKKATVVN